MKLRFHFLPPRSDDDLPVAGLLRERSISPGEDSVFIRTNAVTKLALRHVYPVSRGVSEIDDLVVREDQFGAHRAGFYHAFLVPGESRGLGVAR